MSRVNFEYDETDEKEDINLIINRYKLLQAVQDIAELYHAIYNYKIYEQDVIIYLKADGSKATQKDYDEVSKTGKYLSGGENYISQDWIENRLDSILEDVRHLL